MGLIFDIKRFAVNDGPGIRTTLFLKGCPLRCVWCHNPEGLSTKPVKLYTKKKCIGCQSCVEICPEHNLRLTPDGIKDLGHCVTCGKCTDECPTLALQMAGKEWNMDDLMTIVEKERQVMEESGGGVTLCGGEPLMQAEYALELLEELKRRHFHTTLDTTLFAPESVVRKVIPLTDLFLVDLKHMDSEKHKFYTHVPNEQIHQNIKLISEAGARFWIRIPLIVGVNADDENLVKSAKFLANLPNTPEWVNLLVYHDIGIGKHVRLGSEYNPENISMEPPSEQVQQHALDIFKEHGLNVKIGG
jgi:pyruvate formate lyase activating enzyme